MATISINITATEQDFITFAADLKYQDFVSKSDAEMALLVEPISIQDTIKPNPQSKTDFLLAYFRRVVTDELARVKIQNIQRQIDDVKEAEKVAMRNAIESAVTVTVS